jgi:hypothetical protein
MKLLVGVMTLRYVLAELDLVRSGMVKPAHSFSPEEIKSKQPYPSYAAQDLTLQGPCSITTGEAGLATNWYVKLAQTS